MTDAGSRDANQNVRRANLRNWNVCMFQSFSDVSELYRSHHQNPSLVTRHLSRLLCTLGSKSAGLFLCRYTSDSENLARKDLAFGLAWSFL